MAAVHHQKSWDKGLNVTQHNRGYSTNQQAHKI